MQNNSRNKASKRGTGKNNITTKNNIAINQIFKDLDMQGVLGNDPELPENIYIGRVSRKLGNGRMEVMYAEKKEDKIVDNFGEVIQDKVSYEIKTDQARIRGTFRGKGKRSLWIDVNSIVVIEDSGIGIMEIRALMTRDQLKDLAKETYIHPQILSDQAISGDTAEDAIEFDRTEPEEFSNKDIDNI